MAASTQTSTHAGGKVSISATLPLALTGSAYEVPTYTEIKEATDLGAIGRVYNLVDHQPLSSRGTQQRKGSYNDGAPQLQVAWTPGDPGQAIVQTALNSDNYYTFKYEYQNGTIVYFQALVTSAPINGGTIDTMVGSTINLAVKPGSIVFVHPA